MNNNYTFGRALWQLFATCITGGLYLVYKILQYMHNH